MMNSRELLHSAEAAPQCKIHVGKTLDLYCKAPRCETPICALCLIRDHVSHVDQVEETDAERQREERCRDAVRRAVEEARASLVKRMNRLMGVKGDIEARTTACITKLRREKEEKLAEVSRRYDTVIQEAQGALEIVGRSLGDTLTLINTNMSRLHELEENMAASDAGRTLRDIQRDLVGTLSETRHYNYMEYSDNQLVTMTMHVSLSNSDQPITTERETSRPITGGSGDEERQADGGSAAAAATDAMTTPIRDAAQLTCTVLESLRCNIRLVAPLDETRLAVMPARIQEPRLMVCRVMRLSDMRGPHLEAHPTSMVAVHLGTQPALALSFFDGRIEFRDAGDLSRVLHSHQVARGQPGRMCTVPPSTLLYEYRGITPSQVYTLDCSSGKPMDIGQVRVTRVTAPPLEGVREPRGTDIRDMVVVEDAQKQRALLVVSDDLSNVHAYDLETGAVAWRLRWRLPGMGARCEGAGVTSDPGRGLLYLCDRAEGNRCIQVVSVNDGQYLGCLEVVEDQWVGACSEITWCEEARALVVIHWRRGRDYITAIRVEGLPDLPESRPLARPNTLLTRATSSAPPSRPSAPPRDTSPPPPPYSSATANTRFRPTLRHPSHRQNHAQPSPVDPPPPYSFN